MILDITITITLYGSGKRLSRITGLAGPGLFSIFFKGLLARKEARGAKSGFKLKIGESYNKSSCC